ncbi:MAG: hypothetical protein ACJ74J_23025 [Blastocatellia bacterium]
MRSLFLKILAWFWLASALVLLAQFFVNEVTHREEHRPPLPSCRAGGGLLIEISLPVLAEMPAL